MQTEVEAPERRAHKIHKEETSCEINQTVLSLGCDAVCTPIPEI